MQGTGGGSGSFRLAADLRYFHLERTGKTVALAGKAVELGTQGGIL